MPTGQGRAPILGWSEAVKEKKDSAGVFYYWKGERPMTQSAAVGWDGGDPDGVRRSCGRVLHDAGGHAP
jgi:hypothetical protein